MMATCANYEILHTLKYNQHSTVYENKRLLTYCKLTNDSRIFYRTIMTWLNWFLYVNGKNVLSMVTYPQRHRHKVKENKEA
jgi:hypothetical protein